MLSCSPPSGPGNATEFKPLSNLIDSAQSRSGAAADSVVDFEGCTDYVFNARGIVARLTQELAEFAAGQADRNQSNRVFATCGGGGTGRRKGLKIPFPFREVRVRFPPSAPLFKGSSRRERHLHGYSYPRLGPVLCSPCWAQPMFPDHSAARRV